MIKKDIKLNWYSITWVLIGVVLGLMIGMTIFVLTFKHSADEFEITSTSTSEESTETLTTYLYDHTVLSGEAAESARDDINEILSIMESKSISVIMQLDDENFDTYFYNKKHEMYRLSYDNNVVTIKVPNKCFLNFNEELNGVSIDQDIDYLTLIHNVINITEKDIEGVTFIEMTNANEDSTTKEYRIDINGEEAIKEIYSSVSDEFAENMLENFKAITSEGDEPRLIYCFLIDPDMEAFTAYCYNIIDNTEYLSWVCDGYIDLYDWELDDSWYSTDFEITDALVMYSMADKVGSDIQSMINQFAEDHNIEIDDVTADNSEIGTE